MSNITRRNFLKGAGVMALAVAAAGVLSGCDGNSSNPVMADVKVEYWRNSGFPGVEPTHLTKYDETVSVVKGGKVKKEQLTNLGEILSLGSTGVVDDLEEFDVDWTAETPVAKVYLETR